jgi:tetratricopeptide (TPR) repeat protein
MRRFALLAVLLLSAAPTPASAEVIEPRGEYHKCFVLARTQPEQGWEEALAWQSLGGGEAARHCGALALIGLGKHEEAAHRLEALAQESRRPETVRAEMLAQAGQAWLLAGKPQQALAVQDTALKLVPGSPELLLDKAVTLAQVAHYQEAKEALDEVLKRQPNRIEAMVLRASAQRYLGQPALAKDDVARALVLDPDSVDALLERGMLRRLDGDDVGARADWVRVLTLAPPDSPVAEATRRNLEMMDVKAK